MAPAMSPKLAAMVSTHSSAITGPCVLPPTAPSSHPPPPAISHAISRCSPMPSATSSTSASAIDLSSTERNGGENNCSRALKAASSITGLLKERAGLVPRTRSSHHNCRESGCELRVQSGTRIIELLVPFDSEVRKRACRKMMRTSESGHWRGRSRRRHQSLNVGSMHPPQTQGKVQSAVRLALSGMYLLHASALTGLIDCQMTSKAPEELSLPIMTGLERW